ncbi:hypothetical protein RvY_18074 [Ramazzottius varieornatus]|uniref:Major facilitator superfamily (MFS) profile domain-containing protein n=1 Tax=Ramazzottius varieornatus TaxID=947166 RepID=A0A1D1W4F3_RAMVA|nr:hypothetical protein RvY_18074 [Ramazzottius varieornatus]
MFRFRNIPFPRLRRFPILHQLVSLVKMRWKWLGRKMTAAGFDVEEASPSSPTAPSCASTSPLPISASSDSSLVKRSHGEAVDSGWAWVVLAASFFILAIINGATTGTSIFYTEFLKEFDRGTVLTSGLISTSYGLISVTGPLGSILSNKFGCRPVTILGSLIAAIGYFSTYFVQDFEMMFLTFGVLTGVGFGMAYSPAFGIIAMHFRRRQTLATSAVTVGIGLGIIAIPPIQEVMVRNYGWRESFLLTGSLTLLIVFCAMLFPKHRTSTQTLTLAESANLTLFREVPFYILCLHFFLMAGVNIYGFLSVRFATDIRGISKQDVTWIIAVGGVTDMVGRLSAVALSSNRWSSGRRTRFAVVHVMTVLVVGCIVLFTWSKTLVGLAGWSGALGFFLAVKWAVWPGLQMELFGNARFSTSYAYGSFVMGLGSLALPPLGEQVGVVTGNDLAPFYLSGIFVVFAAVTGVILQFFMPPVALHDPLHQPSPAEILSHQQAPFDDSIDTLPGPVDFEEDEKVPIPRYGEDDAVVFRSYKDDL